MCALAGADTYVCPYDSKIFFLRSIESGMWTSKLGKSEDIEHKTLEGLEGEEYGTIECILKRARG